MTALIDRVKEKSFFNFPITLWTKDKMKYLEQSRATWEDGGLCQPK